MSNPFEDIGHGLKVVGEDIWKAVEFLPKAEKVISSAIKDQPEIKTAVLSLVKQATVVIGDVATDTADKGINLSADAKTLADAEAFFNYFKTSFIPLVEAVYAEVKTDVTTTSAPAA